MKKLFTLLFIFSLCVLTACGGENTPPTEETAEWEPFPYELMFQVGYSHETHSEDGTLVCSCHHEIPKLLPSGELTTAQQTSVVAFHAAMDEILAGSRLLYDSLSETALADYAYRTVTGLGWDGYYTDEMTYTAHTTPYAVAIDFKGYTYAGGPHPGEGNVCYLFDLEKGAMASIDEISDGEAFRSALAEEILRQIAENGLAPNYYEDYETTVRNQNEVQYFFHSGGITVYFADYTLGPHAAGYPIFEVPADVYQPTLNERGLRLLGYTE